MTNAPLFWRCPLPPMRERGPYTLTNSNGGGYLIIWRFERVFARGGAAMINELWDRLR